MNAVRNAIRLGRIGGIEIGLDWSWFIVFAFVTWMLAAHYFPMSAAWPIGTAWLVGAVTSLLFFASVLAHELGHSLVAIRKGIPVRAITLFIFGGVAQLSREPRRAGDEFWIAIAGPAVSAVLGLLFHLLHLSAPAGQPLAALTLWLGWINLSLAVFNLIPGFPLDGGRVLRSVVWRLTGSFTKATRFAAITGRVVAYALIALGLLIALAGNWIGGLWLAFIGWFLSNAAASSYRQVSLSGKLKGIAAHDLMLIDCPRLDATVTLRALIDNHIYKGTQRCFPVMEGDRVAGIVTLRDVTAIPQSRWERTMVREAMTPFEQTLKVRPDQDLAEVLELMTTEEVEEVSVAEDQSFLGLISLEHLRAVAAWAELSASPGR